MARVADNSRAIAVTLVGATVGGIAGYLFFTESGLAVRRQLEPAIDEIARELMAVLSVLEAMLLIGVGVAGWLMYKRVRELINGIEQRQVVPLMARVNAIFDDVKGVTAKVKGETERVDHAIHSTMDRIDDTAERVRSNVRAKASRLIGIVRGVRHSIEAMLRSRQRPDLPRCQCSGVFDEPGARRLDGVGTSGLR